MNSRAISLILSIFILISQTMAIPAFAASQSAQVSVNALSESAHKSYKNREFLKAAQAYEKAYSLQKNAVFIDNAVTAYLSHSFDLANDKNYDDAIKYAQKALSLKPNEQNAKELLADIYYAKGSDNYYQGYPEKAKPDFENSLKYSVLPEQSEKAREGLSMLKSSPSGAVIKPSAPSSNLSPNASVPEIVKLMELKIYGKSQDKLPVLDRIQKLEKDIFNKNYASDSLITRLDRLKKSVLPELAQSSANKFAEGDDYIQDIIEQSYGTARIFGKMPILVFFKSPDTKTYDKTYKDAVLAAMKEWEDATEGKIKFEATNNELKANLQVEWQDYFEDFAWQPQLKTDDVAAERQRLKYRKASSLVQIGSIAAMVAGAFGVPVIGALGAYGGSVASPLLQYKSLNLDDVGLPVKINTAQTNGLSKEQASQKIKQIALHQLGHAIGVYGHSPDPNDIMYSNFTAMSLSKRDKNTIKEIYKNVKTEEKEDKKKK